MFTRDLDINYVEISEEHFLDSEIKFLDKFPFISPRTDTLTSMSWLI